VGIYNGDGILKGIERGDSVGTGVSLFCQDDWPYGLHTVSGYYFFPTRRGIHMRLSKVGFLINLSIWFLCVMPALGADAVNIGVVDFQKILAGSEAGKQAQAEIEKKGKAMEADLKAKGAELEESKARFDREALVMSQEKRAEKERELRIKLMDFKDKEKQYKQDFNNFNMELVGQFRTEIFKIAEELGKKENFLLILEKRESGILYCPGSIDITDRIIQKYNAIPVPKAK
jgi:outer membrane protein